MNDDAFTTDARAEAKRRWEFIQFDSYVQAAEENGKIHGFEKGAEWARDHLAAQEPTDDAVCDMIEDRLSDAMFTACVQEPDGEMTTYVDAPMAEVLRIARDALSAARDARRDEEKR